MNITFAKSDPPKTGAVAILVPESKKLPPSLQKLSKQSRGSIARALKEAKFEGKSGQIVQILTPAGTRLSRLLVFGVGKASNLKATNVEAVGGQLAAKLAKSGEKIVTVVVDMLEGAEQGEAVLAAHVGYGALLRSYRFDKYKTKDKAKNKPSLTKVAVATADPTAARNTLRSLASDRARGLRHPGFGL